MNIILFTEINLKVLLFKGLNEDVREIFVTFRRILMKYYVRYFSYTSLLFFFNFPLSLQSVPIHPANVVKSCTKTCRRVLTSTLLYLIGSEPSCDLGSVTSKLNLKTIFTVTTITY
jgi:hypothetical protein